MKGGNGVYPEWRRRAPGRTTARAAARAWPRRTPPQGSHRWLIDLALVTGADGVGTPSPSGCAQNLPVRSYVGWTQWALLMDPPPELLACLIAVAPHNMQEAVYRGGAFHLGDFLHWAAMLINQERFTGLRAAARAPTMKRRLARSSTPSRWPTRPTRRPSTARRGFGNGRRPPTPTTRYGIGSSSTRLCSGRTFRCGSPQACRTSSSTRPCTSTSRCVPAGSTSRSLSAPGPTTNWP
ncbi:CocE/NonD family hydrolase [Streptomyces mirabilis]|uniref:CocE/NonD family hydrolase n=1 Tax=Streptomyces mirabilis TaxID=68239 RepID=UPI0033A69C5C